MTQVKHATYDMAIEEMANSSINMNTIHGSLWGRMWPKWSMAVKMDTVMVICRKAVMNQAHQWTALVRPIIFIT